MIDSKWNLTAVAAAAIYISDTLDLTIMHFRSVRAISDFPYLRLLEPQMYSW